MNNSKNILIKKKKNSKNIAHDILVFEWTIGLI